MERPGETFSNKGNTDIYFYIYCIIYIYIHKYMKKTAQCSETSLESKIKRNELEKKEIKSSEQHWDHKLKDCSENIC